MLQRERRKAGTLVRRWLAAALLLALASPPWSAPAWSDDGRFHRLAGEIVVDPKDLSTAKVTLSIEAASIDTGIGRRDNHLRSEDFFDVRQFSSITFESLRVEGTGRRATVFGRLTLHGVTRELAVPVEVDLTDLALVATGEFVINRRDYGIAYQSSVNPIGNEVRVAFTLRARAG